jgi:predicted N-acyltransferase
MVTIKHYNRSKFDEWDHFVRQSNNGTIFHLQKFLDYHPVNQFDFHHLMFYDGNKLIAVLPAAVRNDGKLLASPIGASYGGLVLGNIKYQKNEEIIDVLLEYSARQGFQKIHLTPAPVVYHKQPIQDIDYALTFKGFDNNLHYISHVVKHCKGDHVAEFRATARKYIHRYQRNPDLNVKLANTTREFEEMYPILLENKARHNARPTHTLDELIRIRELFPNEINLFAVRLKDKLIAASLNFRCNSQVLLCFYNMMLYEFEKLRPTYAVMHEVIQWSNAHGFQFFDIGVSQNTTSENPMTPSYLLIDFKEQFNAKGILRSTFRKNL